MMLRISWGLREESHVQNEAGIFTVRLKKHPGRSLSPYARHTQLGLWESRQGKSLSVPWMERVWMW